MRSVIGVTVAKPEFDHSGLAIPLSLTISDDDSLDDELPESAWVCYKIFVSFKKCQMSEEKIREEIHQTIDELKINFGFGTHKKIHEEMDKYLAKNSFSQYGTRYIPTPDSFTLH